MTIMQMLKLQAELERLNREKVAEFKKNGKEGK